jgi:phage gp29-like protein
MGKEVDRQKFWTLTTGAEHDDQPYGMGLAHYLYWPVFFKRNGLKYWAVFLEKFGQPTPMARLPQGQMNDPALKRKALEALQAIQVDSGVLIPDGIVIELLEAARSGTADYQALQDKMDAAISKIVLSQTMTTDNGSSRSQAEVHAGVRDEVIKADADLICESLNDGIIPYLTALNFPNAQPPKVWRNTEPEEDLQQRVEIDKGIHALGFEPTEDYIRETYGEGWVKRQPQAPMGGMPGLNFAENSITAGAIATRRADMETLTRIAETIATEYQEVLGKRVNQLLAYAEDSGDLETFRQRLNELLADGPQQDTVDAVQNATWASRLLGMFRAQR